MRRLTMLLTVTLLVPTVARATLCLVPCGDPHPWACYEAKVRDLIPVGGAIVVPGISPTIVLPPALDVITRRVCTPACRPGDVCPALDGSHLVAHEGWPLPGLDDLPVTLTVGATTSTVRLSRGGFVLLSAAKALESTPEPVPFEAVYACWAASGTGKTEIAYRDQFGDGVARTHQLAQVCLGATYGAVTSTGALACYRTRRNTLPEEYVPRQQVFVTPALGDTFVTRLEGLDEFCVPATVEP